MVWIYIALGTAIALAAADLCVKLASGRLSNSIALLLTGACIFIAGAIWVVWERLQGAPQFAEPRGIWAAVGAGISFSLVTLGLYATFGTGAAISVVSPSIRLGGLLLASLAGLTFLREPLTVKYAIGILLAGVGVYLIITR